ncbi:MAG: hypothetical protein Ta2E_01340 [Mycoplasmoidaceae bacterium]|nr:MAG: hypothetical protein Ta2E_01340 [Mycoplasmoidaceae bacterium]
MKAIINSSVYNDMVTKKRDYLKVSADRNDSDDIEFIWFINFSFWFNLFLVRWLILIILYEDI